jgi:predicted transcriptional regulator
MTPSPQRLGDLQLAIMRVLWERGEASVADVHCALEPERGLALTTIATMLTKMEAKGTVTHRTAGRRFIYQPVVSESEVRRSMVGELTERLFRGDTAALVSHLLTEHQIDPDELAELEALIEQHHEEER